MEKIRSMKPRAFTPEERVIRAACLLAAGAAIACLVITGISQANAVDPLPEFARPETVKSTEDVAVARIPYRKGEVIGTCVLYINFNARDWALSC